MSILTPATRNRLLLIDDSDQEFRANLALMLAQEGYTVLEASTAAQGVGVARAELPDVILCDTELQGVGANIVLYSIRRDPKIGATPFLFMSRFGVSEEKPEGLEHGADGFLAKPIIPAKLVAAVSTCLGGRKNAGAPNNAKRGVNCADDTARLLTGMLHHVVKVVDTTWRIATGQERLERAELLRLASEAHHVACRLRDRIEQSLEGAATDQFLESP